MKYYEKERVQSSTGLQTKAQKLLRENEVLKRLLEPSRVSENCRDQSLADGLKCPHTDWKDTSTRTQTPWLINVDSGEFQGEVSGYFQPLSSYVCLDSPLKDNTELADSNYSFLVEKHHIRSPIFRIILRCSASQMVLS